MFEGGIRVNAFVSGGLVPAAVRGTKLDGMIHIGARRAGLRLTSGPGVSDRWYHRH